MIGEVSGIIKRHETENEERWNRTTNKISEIESSYHHHHHHREPSSVDASPPMALLERQITKNFAEINRMVLDLDILSS